MRYTEQNESYYNKNREAILKARKEYYYKNRERILEYNKRHKEKYDAEMRKRHIEFQKATFKIEYFEEGINPFNEKSKQ